MMRNENARITAEVVDYVGKVYKSVNRGIKTDDAFILRDVITKAPCVSLFVKHIEKNVFIVNDEFRAGCMRNELGFPAGMIDDGESPEEAAMRELLEETGYKPYRLVNLGQAYSSSGFTDELLHYFYAEVKGEPQEQSLDKDEHITTLEMSGYELIRAFMDNKMGSQSHTCYLKYILSGLEA